MNFLYKKGRYFVISLHFTWEGIIKGKILHGLSMGVAKYCVHKSWWLKLQQFRDILNTKYHLKSTRCSLKYLKISDIPL